MPTVAFETGLDGFRRSWNVWPPEEQNTVGAVTVEPGWWLKAHPDDAMVWDAPGKDQTRAIVASPDYLRDAAQRLAALVAHLEEKFGSRVAGYHPCGQNTREWFYQNTWDSPLNGYAQGDRRAWRTWLARRYASDAALQAAWHDPRARLTAAESVALAGKMWLYEDDTSTYLSMGGPPGWRDRVHSLAETNAQLLRNTTLRLDKGETRVLRLKN